jgi:prepilin-type N-terminal cleavage/methylation domain-containing protein
MQNVRNNKGFTLIELMIVVVIIGILAAIAIPRFTQVSQGAKQAEAGPILKQMCSIGESELLKAGAYPTDETALATAGFEDPTAEYFVFTFAGTATTGVATATPNAAGAGLATQTMDCVTGDIS